MLKVFVITVLPLLLMLYAIIDCAVDDAIERTGLHKVIWILIIILIPYVGPLAWTIVAHLVKPRRPRPTSNQRPPHPLAPDDNPQFLRHLAEEQALRKRREEREKNHRDESGGHNPDKA
jgi:hypothetical protein